ncbi:MAG: DUF488 family protein [Mesorhizobium sp.]|uniref:DUF488 domain-containing protein n=1 Tax=unclassified Mesorhizobium TaxID=325217 RepID=UPI000FCA9977|nr:MULTISPECIES: DUF488 domain-containing protein [unclassified Mesorhizobium]RUV41827.1 DUF488 domain-containing protein [Mesorhizobium sp. M1A.T.Ca.IN.004.03.1.1]RWH50353.1 MAG: DUF488 domain-containing protein [Mesorhizobium sp.]RWK37861.1 MAG: DUF488 domain-containing protein [Mesorhizobium sp.]RWK85484.1 MAG: DUF488 domain-containing protein [Mesorhizobium sp.]TIP15698.1 MAG: DUF488 family protein [Mesorhizobium sp.]
MARRIYTFGYEGLTIERFIERLQSARINLVVDVRATPLSRKRGFSKAAFEQALSAAGIAYVHAKAMGCPKAVRDRYKRDGSWSTYTASFLQYLSGQEAALAEVANITQSKNSCLVCFEADHRFCHRTYVARAAARKTGSPITHLTDQTEIVEPFGAVAA